MGNTFGNSFCFTSFGESHGKAIGGVIDGCPAGMVIDTDYIRLQLDRRAGRVSDMVGMSSRAYAEKDDIEWLSGIYEGKTLGTPIAFLIRNSDVRSEDYEPLRHVFRPGHADYTYFAKYGIRDHRGGGRASARETVARVVAGAIAQQILKSRGISIKAEIAQIGNCSEPDLWHDYISDIARCGDSIGGIVRCVIKGVPAGVGEPVFDKLQSRLASAIMSINGCKGFDYGTGFAGVSLIGSEANNISGGISGGISDGTDIIFRAVFKPTPSISLPQHTVDEQGQDVEITLHGRHDTCYLPRVLPVVESMAALVMINSEFRI